MKVVPEPPKLVDVLCQEDRQQCALADSDPRLRLPIRRLCHDSRQVRPGDVYVAITGRAHDGHRFIGDAIAAQASLVICSKPVADLPAPFLVHPNPRELMGRMAQALYGDPASALTVVAITGTNGKTTTAHLVAAIFAAAQGKAGLMGTLGTAVVTSSHGVQGRSSYDHGQGLTTPEAPELMQQLARLRDDGVDNVVLEASSIALCEGRLRQAPADVAVITNLTQDHLDYHGDFSAYGQAKALLFSGHRKPRGVSVWPLEMARAQWAPVPPDGALMTYSASLGEAADSPRADVALHAPSRVGQDGQTRMLVRTPRGLLRLTSPLVGSFNEENVLAAVAVAEALGLPEAAIASGLQQFTAVPGRMERVLPPSNDEGCRPLVLVDFAHTPDALQRVIAAVRDLTHGRVIVVVGCGGDRDPGKRPLMGEMAARGDLLWITSDNPRFERAEDIAAAMLEGVHRVHDKEAANAEVFVQLDRRKAIAAAIAQSRAEDTVLIAGKGHEPYQIIGAEKVPFDDRACAKSALADWTPQQGSAP